MSSLSPSYLNALLSSHYLPLELPTPDRDRDSSSSSSSSLFSLLKSRHISNSRHESVYCQKRAFHLSFQRRQTLWWHDMLGHYGSVQSIHLSPDECLLASGGEDGRLLVWDIQQCLRCSDVTREPGTACTELVSMKPLGFCSVAFGAGGDQVAASGNGFTLLCDVSSKRAVSSFGTQVRGVAAHPSCEALFASASDQGRVSIWDRRTPGESALEVASSCFPFRGVQFHPTEPHFLSTANTVSGAALYDVRLPNTPCLRYKLGTLARRREHVTHVTFNSTGTQVLVQIKEHDPLLFDAPSGEPICRFFHLEMKNRISRQEQKGCFLGMEDEFVAVGSEDFRIYVWRVPVRSPLSPCHSSNEMLDLYHMPHMVLSGHRSVVSKLLFSKNSQLLLSAGAEKLIKVWSPWKLPSRSAHEHRSHSPVCRPRYSRWQYIELLMTNGRLSPSLAPLDPQEETREEDPVMMAFYDVLIDDLSNNGMFFSFSPDELDAASLSDSSLPGHTESSTATSWIENGSDILGELSSTGDTYNSSNEQTDTTEFDLYYDSDL